MRRVRFLVIFFALLAVLETLLLLEPVDKRVIRPFSSAVATASGMMLRAVGEQVRVAGTVIAGTCMAVDIHNGCNGVEATMFVVAAILAFPAPWRVRGIGAVAGIAALQLANLIRVVTLYVIGCHHREWFEAFHVAVWQSLMFALAIGYFIVWSRRATPARVA